MQNHPALRISIIDDSIDIREIIAEIILTHLKIKSLEFESGNDFKKKFTPLVFENLNTTNQTQISDIVITDLNMPNGGGLDVIHFLKEHSPKTKVILVTGETLTLPSSIQPIQVFYLTKPFEDEDLLRLLDQCQTKI